MDAAARVRPLAEGEVDAVVRLWSRTKRAALTWLRPEQGRSFEEDSDFFRGELLRRCAMWVACVGDELAGLLAVGGSRVEQLYVAPEWQGRGVGSTLLDHARVLSPQGLTLFTLQRNTRARRFYERRGFRAVRFGTSPPPEDEPDVLYAWRPAPGAAGSSPGPG